MVVENLINSFEVDLFEVVGEMEKRFNDFMAFQLLKKIDFTLLTLKYVSPHHHHHLLFIFTFLYKTLRWRSLGYVMESIETILRIVVSLSVCLCTQPLKTSQSILMWYSQKYRILF